MRRALDELDVDGLATNRALLGEIVGHPRFGAADITTGWLAELLA
jgi:biotin carboxylase